MSGARFEDDPAIIAAVNAHDTSFWLQTVLRSSFGRDPVDVLNDLEHAMRLIGANVDRQLEQH